MQKTCVLDIRSGNIRLFAAICRVSIKKTGLKKLTIRE